MTAIQPTWGILVPWALGERAWPNVFVQWAVDMLVAGHDSYNLRILAGLDDSPKAESAEHERLFWRAMRELGEPEPERQVILEAHAYRLAKSIAEGVVDWPDGVALLSLVLNETQRDRDADTWCDLLHKVDYLFDDPPLEWPVGFNLDTAEEVVRAEARRLMERLRRA